MIEIYNRIKERDDAEDEYTEDVEEDEEEYTDEELLDEINKVIAVVLKNVKSNFLETLQILGPTISSFINDENTTVKFCGLSIVSDILEHCGPDSVPFKEMFVKVISESVTSANASIRQICTNAIGMAAQYGGDGYAEFCLHC